MTKQPTRRRRTAPVAHAVFEPLEPRQLLSTTYYVSPSGFDQNAGTSTSKPWKTVAHVNAITFHPGDKILFQGGAAFAGNLKFTSADAGTAANPVLVSSYGSGRATIKAGSGNGITVLDAGGFTISQLNVVGPGLAAGTGNSGGIGISFLNDSTTVTHLPHAYIDHVDVGGFGLCGMGIGGTRAGAGFTDVRITYSSAHDNWLAGIWSYVGRYDDNPPVKVAAHLNVYVGHDLAYNNPGANSTKGFNGNGIVLSQLDGGVIERCVAHGNGAANTGTNGGAVGIWCYCSNNVTIQYNESYGNTSAHLDGGGLDFDGGTTNSVMQYNYSHDNAGAGILLAQPSLFAKFSNNVVRYNISQNDGRKNGYSAVEVGGAIASNPYSNTEIYGNTLYISKPSGGSSAGIIVKGATVNLHVRNNIIYTTGGTPSVIVNTAGSGMLFQGNDYWTGSSSAINLRWLGKTYNTLSAWRSATGQEKVGSAVVGTSVAPLLTSPGKAGTLNNADNLSTVTQYKLWSGSPLIDNGVDLWAMGVNPTHDYYGDAVTQGKTFDIGADEVVVAHTFTSSDIGGPSPAGRTTVVTAGQAYDVSAGGAQIGGSSDHFRFVYTSITGDFDVKVRIAAFDATDAWAKAGLMVRSGLAANSPEFFAFAQAGSGMDGIVARTTTGATATQATGGSPRYPNAWLRIRRVGNTFTAYYGTNGASWTALGAAKTFTGMASTVYLGLAINSRVNGQLATAQFRDLLFA
jgi:hypothetical protein